MLQPRMIYVAVFDKIISIVPDEIKSPDEITLVIEGKRVPNNTELASNYKIGIGRFNVAVRGKTYQILRDKRERDIASLFEHSSYLGEADAELRAIQEDLLKSREEELSEELEGYDFDFDDDVYGGGASDGAGAGSGI
jgi:hypothetical protein